MMKAIAPAQEAAIQVARAVIPGVTLGVIVLAQGAEAGLGAEVSRIQDQREADHHQGDQREADHRQGEGDLILVNVPRLLELLLEMKHEWNENALRQLGIDLALRQRGIDLAPLLVPEGEVAVVLQGDGIHLSRMNHPHDEGHHHGIQDVIVYPPRPGDGMTVRLVGNEPDLRSRVIVPRAGIDRGRIAQIRRIVGDRKDRVEQGEKMSHRFIV